MRDTQLNPRNEDPGAKLPAPVSRVLETPVDEATVQRMWRRIEDRRGPRAASLGMMLRWASVGAALALLAVLVGSVALRAWRAPQRPADIARTEGPLLLAGGAPIVPVTVPAGAAPVTVRLADGSSIRVDPGAALSPLASSAHQVVLRLTRGRAEFHVQPGGPRRFVIEAGLASVEVVGTVLTVTRTESSVTVEVAHGVVLVRGRTVPDGVARLEAGGVLIVKEDGGALPAVVAPGSAAPPPSRAPRETAPPEAGSGKPWRDAFAVGDYAGAYGTLGADGLARETASAADADDLFVLSDVARLSGHPAEAVAPLERLMARYPADPRAPIAGVTLGRIELGLSHPRRAALALERALALGVPSGLLEDAYVRLVEALVETGDRDAARAAAQEYRERVPHGRRGADVARWLAQ